MAVAGQGSLEAAAVILAPGNSARDTFAMLLERGVQLQAKPFSIGVRVEHPQALIDEAQYGASPAIRAWAPPITSCVFHAPSGRSAYTFCMCPGGLVVAAATEAGGRGDQRHEPVRPRQRPTPTAPCWSASRPLDFGSDHPLAGIEFQRVWERKAFALGGSNYCAPVQLVGDFLADRPSDGAWRVRAHLPSRSGGWRDLAACLPGYVTETLRLALPFFDQRLPGFSPRRRGPDRRGNPQFVPGAHRPRRCLRIQHRRPLPGRRRRRLRRRHHVVGGRRHPRRRSHHPKIRAARDVGAGLSRPSYNQ